MKRTKRSGDEKQKAKADSLMKQSVLKKRRAKEQEVIGKAFIKAGKANEQKLLDLKGTVSPTAYKRLEIAKKLISSAKQDSLKSVDILKKIKKR